MAELRQIFRCEIGCFKNGFMRHPYFQQAAGNFEFAFKLAFITTFLSALLETLLFTYRQSVSVMSRRPYLRGGGGAYRQIKMYIARLHPSASKHY